MMNPNDLWVSPEGVKIKAWFVMRRDLEMSQGKFGVQIGHGADMIHIYGSKNPFYEHWLSPTGGNRRKIVLGAKNLLELQKIAKEARHAGMTVFVIGDAGLTEFGKPTMTGIVICPHEDSNVPNSLKRAQSWKD
jgi:peptidyl-tRNA hydrolase